ncbi:hypothetical protein BC939DRAFT_505540 [Gamsiella multidivaricata]|uniref:uncharacterized protein n=1 Tax=Gamsiella multidivaricata TaxID=101098 RepID=UPI00221FAF57|nr:uncharacterized protein BC939DRAFT_505540 [Gamsiella multidivaricata]KAG0364378.1 hypothetical protein BGZ54_007589 [Gamsiella multidivaricata]KAI7819705.1 hypothetical protein BC939DRAFT_505540 [Gamsiella multidivaricata]
MPILYNDPWCAQYFEHAKCPDNVTIPTEDWHAWSLFPDHRWIYDKLTVALTQGLEAAPHGVYPKSYPIFSKPMMNLRSMGAGSFMIPDKATYIASLQPGHFWSTFLTGKHVSTDAAILDGEMVWCRHTTGVSMGDGMFDYWHIHVEAMPEIEDWCGAWTRKYLAGYTGMVNFETIGGKIIEAHLRFADQWPDLYGEGWVDAMVRLYSEKCWDFDDSERQEHYSVVLWAPHGRSYRHPPAASIAKAKAEPGIVSVQVTFYEDLDPVQHSNPPGGFRLAIVNATNLAAGRRAIEILHNTILNQDSQVERKAVLQLSSL